MLASRPALVAFALALATNATNAHAQTNNPALSPPPPPLAPATPARPGPWFMHLNLGLNAYTYLAANPNAAPPMPEQHVHPGNRLILLQQLGAGYFVHPRVSLRLTLQFAEYALRNPTSQQMEGAFSLFGTIAWAAFHAGPFFAGAGPIVAFYTPRGPDVGIFTAVGASAPVGRGFALGGAVQMPIMLLQRVQFAVSPALFVAKRF